MLCSWFTFTYRERAHLTGGKLPGLSYGPSRLCPQRQPLPGTNPPLTLPLQYLTFVFLPGRTRFYSLLSYLPSHQHPEQGCANNRYSINVCYVKQVKASISITHVEKALTELPNNPFFVLAKNTGFLSFQNSKFSILTLLPTVKGHKSSRISSQSLLCPQYDRDGRRRKVQKAKSAKL